MPSWKCWGCRPHTTGWPSSRPSQGASDPNSVSVIHACQANSATRKAAATRKPAEPGADPSAGAYAGRSIAPHRNPGGRLGQGEVVEGKLTINNFQLPIE